MSISGIFICFEILFLAGAWLGVSIALPLFAVLTVFAACACVCVFASNRRLLIVCACALGFCIGILRGQMCIKPSEYAGFENQKVIIDARIVSDIHKARANMQSFEILPQGRYRQKISVLTFSRDNYFYGQRIYAIGKLKAPSSSGSFDYKKYMQARGVYSEMFNPEIYILSVHPRAGPVYFALLAKHFIYGRFFARLPNQRAALLVALIIGQKDLMSADIVAQFNRAGVAHLIAVSGFILTLTLVFAERLKVYTGRFAALSLCLLIAVIYIIMADFASGVFRAAIMAGLYVAAKSFGRQYSIFPVLTLTAAILVLFNPLIIKYDIGFMLSFLSILGIVLFSPILQRMFFFVPAKFGIRQIIAITFAAQIITTPITLYYFSQLSAVAPLANLLVVPVVEFCLALGYVLCLPYAGFIAAKILNLILVYILFVVSFLSSMPFASVNIKISWEIMVCLYVLEGAAYFLAFKVLKQGPEFAKI